LTTTRDSTTPAGQVQRRSIRSVFIACWCPPTASTSPPVRRWPANSGPGTPGRTPRVTTSRCSPKRWRRSRRTTGRAPATRTALPC
jgi:hypothetical protein